VTTISDLEVNYGAARSLPAGAGGAGGLHIKPSSKSDGSTTQQATFAGLSPGGGSNLWSDHEERAAAVLTPDNRFLAAAPAKANCFLTGAAGTGKSTLLRRFIASSSRRIDVTAPTGIAAINIGGMTTHRFCGMLLGPKHGQSDEDYLEELRGLPYASIRAGFRRVSNCECLVIDEVSMMPGRQLDFVDYLFRTLRGVDAPFGDAQVIVTGDFLQLPPVRTNPAIPYDWCFNSRAWKEAGFKVLNLEIVRRQDEKEFVRALLNFRVGRVTGATASLLESRVKMFPPSEIPRLVTHNVQKDKWDAFQLTELPGEPVLLSAETSGPEKQVEFLTKNLLTPSQLMLKIGARVMFTVNKTEPGASEPLFVNGQMGTVAGIHPDFVVVLADNGSEISVERFKWSYDARDKSSGQVQQFPLCLAWALTIHKAQGMTLDRAHIDCRAAREPGQAYVAVSRVRTLEGLSFKEWPKGIVVSNESIRFYQNT